MVNSKLIDPLADEALHGEPVAKTLPLSAIRLRERMEEIDMSQETLAARIGATQGAISQILTGSTRNSRFMPKIAHALRVNLGWLTGVTEEKIDMFDADGREISEDDLASIRAGKSDKTLVHPEQMKAGPSKANNEQTRDKHKAVAESATVDIVEFELAYGLGATFIDSGHVSGKVRTFTREWLRYFTASPFASLMFARGIGDSMMPTVLDADLLLIDTEQRTPRQWDQLWAVEMGGMGMIKRLRPTKDGTGMQIMSDNPVVPSDIAYDGEMNIVGRVVAIVRKT